MVEKMVDTMAYLMVDMMVYLKVEKMVDLLDVTRVG
jgi:hypothetical protein